jgi:arginase
MRQWHIIGVGSGWGAQNMGTADGPKALMRNIPPSFQKFPKTLLYCHGEGPLCFDNPVPLPPCQAKAHTDHVLEMATGLSHQTKNTLLRGVLPLVFGGDHSIAIGTWSGVKAALHPEEDIGLIWIDAHMDAHSPETSPSLNIHGMPIAVLLGYGDPRLTGINNPQPKLKPENLCLIGIRSFEEGEANLLGDLGVQVYQMDEVQHRGFPAIFREARGKIPARRFGLSIDVDAFDPDEAPGTGTPEPSGLRLTDVKKTLYGLAQDPAFLGLEITEFNPYRDINNKTCSLVWELATTITGDIHERR